MGLERLTCGRGGRTECAWGRRACTTAGDRSKSDIYTKSRTCCWASSLTHSLTTTTTVLALTLTDSGGHDEWSGGGEGALAKYRVHTVHTWASTVHQCYRTVSAAHYFFTGRLYNDLGTPLHASPVHDCHLPILPLKYTYKVVIFRM